ncbi:MAG TPA: rhodanese-like domain-containing protein [Feifaniaceae bacterium]|nr:rhodanese-like domain-containing protein [Feifaniaceae bacterium]
MRRKIYLFSFLIVSLALASAGCAAAAESAVSTPVPAPVSSAAAATPIPDEACLACELPEIEPLPEGYSLTNPDGIAAIPEEIDRADLCPPLGEGEAETAPPDEPGIYRQLSYEDAKAWMDEGEAVVVDVRTKEEYEAGHIPGAILIPNETIEGEPPEELPDKGARILIYCRSGNRSYQAALKLLELGYDFVYDFGGINGWPYEIATGA